MMDCHGMKRDEIMHGHVPGSDEGGSQNKIQASSCCTLQTGKVPNRRFSGPPGHVL